MAAMRVALLCALFPVAAGCSALPGRGGDASLRQVSTAADDEPAPVVPSVLAGWADRQRLIFERAWREIRADLAYESIDSFRDLDAEARRDVLVMRREMEAAREAAAARDEALIR